MLCYCFSFIAICYHFKYFILLSLYTFGFFFFRTHTFGDKTLQLSLHLSKLIVNVGFKSIRVGLTKHSSSFNDTHLVTKNSLKLNLSNTIDTCLIRLSIILYYSLQLNNCECLICQKIYEQNCSRLKNHTHFHLKILLQTQYY